MSGAHGNKWKTRCFICNDVHATSKVLDASERRDGTVVGRAIVRCRRHPVHFVLTADGPKEKIR